MSYTCILCGVVSPVYALRCGACGKSNALRPTGQLPTGITALVGMQAPPRVPIKSTSAAPALRPKRLTGVCAIDLPLNGGIVPGQDVIVVGNPGIGKSTAMLAVLFGLCTAEERGLYVSNEESEEDLLEKAGLFGYGSEHYDVFNTASFEEAHRLGRNYAFAVYDSVQKFDCAPEFTAPKTRFLVSRINKAGAAHGENDQLHDPSAVIYLTFPPSLEEDEDPKSPYRVREAVCTKNRQARGPLGRAQYTILEDHGIMPAGDTFRDICDTYFDAKMSLAAVKARVTKDGVIGRDSDFEFAYDVWRERKKETARKKKGRASETFGGED